MIKLPPYYEIPDMYTKNMFHIHTENGDSSKPIGIYEIKENCVSATSFVMDNKNIRVETTELAIAFILSARPRKKSVITYTSEIQAQLF